MTVMYPECEVAMKGERTVHVYMPSFSNLVLIRYRPFTPALPGWVWWYTIIAGINQMRHASKRDLLGLNSVY